MASRQARKQSRSNWSKHLFLYWLASDQKNNARQVCKNQVCLCGLEVSPLLTYHHHGSTLVDKYKSTLNTFFLSYWLSLAQHSQRSTQFIMFKVLKIVTRNWSWIKLCHMLFLFICFRDFKRYLQLIKD